MTERQIYIEYKKKTDLQNIFQMIEKDYCGKFRFVGRKTKFVQYHKCILCGYLYQLDLNWKDNPKINKNKKQTRTYYKIFFK